MFSEYFPLLWLRKKIIQSNKSMIIQIIIPFLFAYFYKYISTLDKSSRMDSLSLMMMCIPFSLAIAVGNPVLSILAEEREKRTLKAVLMSGVSSWKYILSLIFYPIVIAIAVMVFIPEILGQQINNWAIYGSITLLTSMTVILFYLLLGLLSKTQVMAQVLGIPAMLIISFLPMLSQFNSSMGRITDWSFIGLEVNLLHDWNKFALSSHVDSIIGLLTFGIVLLILDCWLTSHIKKQQ